MKVTCPSCQSKYTVADEKVRGKTVKIRCRKCSATILADGTSVPGGATNGAPADPSSASTATSGVEAASEEATYHVSVSDGEPRTMTIPEIVAAYNEGVVQQETFVWADGMTDWLPLGQVEPIVSALHAASAATSIPDTSPNVARRVERNDIRASRDLFVEASTQATAQAVSQEVVTSAPAYTPSPASSSAPATNDAAAAAAAAGPTGQRGENSVLFSLAALTQEAATKPAAQVDPLAKDDSGIIDLKALATGTPAAAQAQVQAPVTAPLFPLGAPEMPQLPLGGPSGESSKSKAMMFVGIGGGVAFLAAIALVAFVMLKGNPPKDEPSAATTASAAPTVSAAPAQTASAAPAESAASSAVAAKPPTVGGGAGGKTSSKSAGGGTAGASANGGAAAAAKPPAPQKPVNADPCGCAGDLMCLMKCSTGKK